MHQRVVKYKDFNNVEHTDTLEFHISQSRLLENWDIVEDLEEIKKTFEGRERDLTPSEIRKLVLVVKRISRLGYGIRSTDGLRFTQKPEIWEAFEESAAYDSFLLELFTSGPTAAMDFVNAIFPDVSGSREELEAKARTMYPHIFDDNTKTESTPTSETIDISSEPVTTDDRPAWLRENREPTQAEFKVATPEQKQIAYNMRFGKS